MLAAKCDLECVLRQLALQAGVCIKLHASWKRWKCDTDILYIYGDFAAHCSPKRLAFSKKEKDVTLLEQFQAAVV